MSRALRSAGAAVPPTLARLEVLELAKLAPSFLVCDVDSLSTDPLEMIRQVRFVLPDCLISVVTKSVSGSWALSCHLAGAHCVLCGDSTESELTFGLHRVMESGCFTDPRFTDLTATA